jgi:hypothetical protein
MAKIDLSALTKKDRVDVTYKLNQPTLSPSGVRGGAYQVAVQSVGPSKTAQLAKNLGQFSSTLKQFADVQEDIGVKQAAGVKAEDLYKELKKEDPAAFLTLNRRKAYRNALYKRAMNYDILPSLSTDSEELLNLNEFGAETDQFVQKRLDPYLEKKWGEFSEKVGDYANDPAAQALWTATTSQWRNNIVENYNKRVEDFNIDAQKQELGLQIEAMGQRGVDESGNQLLPDFSTLPDVLQNRDNLLSEDGMSPRDRTSLMATEVASQATALLASGRIKDASNMIALAEATKINGKPVFRTGTSIKQFADLKQRINNADDLGDERTDAEKRRTYTGQALVSYENLNALDSLDQLDPFTRQTLISTFESLNPEITDEEIEANLAAIFDHPVSSSEGYDQALQEIALNAGDFGNSLYFDTKADVNRRRLELQRREVIMTSLTEGDKQNNLTEFAAWKRDNPQKSAKQWISSQGLQIPLFKELRDKDVELSQGNWVFDNTYYKNANDLLAQQADLVAATAVADITDSGEKAVINSTIDIIAQQSLPDILRNTQEYARSLDPELTEEERNTAIRDFVNQSVTRAAERTRDFTEAFKKRGMVLEETPAPSMARFKTAPSISKTGAQKARYKHLQNETVSYGADFINKERETMLARGDIPQLGRSLINRGFPEWDSQSWKLLDETGLTVQDVRLFASESELDSVTAEWKDVAQKELQLEPLTEEEEAIKDLYQDFGIYDLSTLNTFIAEQRTFLEDTD